MTGPIVITSRAEGRAQLGISRMWEEAWLQPWPPGRRTKTAERFPPWLQKVTRSPGLPSMLRDELFAPRRARP